MYSALHPPSQRLGSFANLNIASIPGGDEGFRIVREWVQDVCRELGYKLPEPVDRSRQWFMIACTLAFDLDREDAWDYVPRMPMYKPTLWPQSLSNREVDFFEQDFVAFVTAEGYDLLTFGSSYLRCVQQDTQTHTYPL